MLNWLTNNINTSSPDGIIGDLDDEYVKLIDGKFPKLSEESYKYLKCLANKKVNEYKYDDVKLSIIMFDYYVVDIKRVDPKADYEITKRYYMGCLKRDTYMVIEYGNMCQVMLITDIMKYIKNGKFDIKQFIYIKNNYITMLHPEDKEMYKNSVKIKDINRFNSVMNDIYVDINKIYNNCQIVMKVDLVKGESLVLDGYDNGNEIFSYASRFVEVKL
jgi:hypothetical protein